MTEVPDPLVEKGALVQDAIHACREGILGQSSFSAENGIRLGGDYIAYKCDSTILVSDLAVSHMDGLGFSTEGVEFRDAKEAFDSILAQAKMGYFRALKEYLRREGEHYSEGNYISIMDALVMTEQERRDFGKKLLEMVESIPDEDLSHPWSPPPLAWQDPKVQDLILDNSE